jgi:hypothetical protein
MVVEHVFVTTLDAPVALHLCTDYLQQRGFAAREQQTFPVGGEWTATELTRGKKNAARAKNVRDVPQTVRIEFDRGRVTVALAIGFNAAWGGGGFGTVTEQPAKMALHARLLHVIAVGLERLLAHNGTGRPDYADWDATEAEILRAARKRRNRGLILLFAIVFVIVLIIVAIVASNR